MWGHRRSNGLGTSGIGGEGGRRTGLIVLFRSCRRPRESHYYPPGGKSGWYTPCSTRSTCAESGKSRRVRAGATVRGASARTGARCLQRQLWITGPKQTRPDNSFKLQRYARPQLLYTWPVPLVCRAYTRLNSYSRYTLRGHTRIQIRPWRARAQKGN